MPEFQTIETYSNWCEIDRLDGTDLKDKEVLEVRFPDNSTVIRPIVVKRTSKEIDDMGHPCRITISKSFVPIDVFGTLVDVPLGNSKIVARRVAKGE